MFIKIISEDGQYVDLNKNRCNLIQSENVSFSEVHPEFSEAVLLADAIDSLSLRLYRENPLYSRYKIKQELEKIPASETTNMWDSIKQLMVANNVYEDFALANDLSFSDPKFSAMYAQLKQNYPEIDTILEQCIL